MTITIGPGEIMDMVIALLAESRAGTVTINPSTLPTSPIGLKPGSLWNDGGVISVVVKTLVPLSSS